jgi:hypothetical protein
MKNKILTALDLLKNDHLMRFDRVSAAVVLLEDALKEIPKEVETSPVPVISAPEAPKPVCELAEFKRDVEITVGRLEKWTMQLIETKAAHLGDRIDGLSEAGMKLEVAFQTHVASLKHAEKTT